MIRSNAQQGQATGRVLVVDDHAEARESMALALSEAGYHASRCGSAVEALKLIERRGFDVVVTDLKMPGMSGLELIRKLEERRVETQIVMVSAHGTVSSAVSAMRHGAFDFIEKPFRVEELEDLVARALRHGALVGRRSSVPRDDAGAAMIGSSAAMRTLREEIDRVAPTDVTLLISGENGTGKELVARAVHAASPRRAGALVGLNCPALSPQLMESELFGHERGAFTSADAPRVGRFELAEGGTILLDEVSEVDLPLQAKLLRVLQEKTYERVGSSETRRTDARVLATTNRDLRQHVAEGRFRDDLYFRLAVVPLQVPPLRDRREDVPALAEHFLLQAAQRLGRAPCELRDDAVDLMTSYDWPGNVRELENLITRASVLGSQGAIDADQLRPWLLEWGPEQSRPSGADAKIAAGMNLQDMERSLIEATLAELDGHREKAAKALGIGVRTLANKLKAYGYAPRAKSFSRTA